MDVGCPKCQTEYELDDARVTEDGVTVKCSTCGHVFRVKKKQLVVTLPSRGDPPIDLGSNGTPAGPNSELPPPPPSREWKLKQPSGNIFPCRDLTMLQKWIIEGKVSRDDEISLTGDAWKRLGNIPELASFFQVVDDAAKLRTLEALNRAQPPPPPAPSVPPPPAAAHTKKITDTWRGGQFSAPEPSASTPPPERSKPGNDASPSITQTLQGGRFSPPPPQPPPRQTTPAPVRRPSSSPEPSEADLRRAVGRGGGGKWLALIFAGLLVGGGVGWYFGYSEPEQKRLEQQRASDQARMDEEARIKAALPPTPVVVLDASVEDEVAPDAGIPLGAGVADGGAPVIDAGVPAVDAGLAGPPVVVGQKKSFDWLLAQGDRLRERDKPEAALDFYGKAADLKPERVEPITGRGLALLDMSNPSAAAATFETAVKLNSRYGPAIMGLAEAYRILGKNAKAVEFYQRYLDVLPNGAEASVARNNIDRLKK